MRNIFLASAVMAITAYSPSYAQDSEALQASVPLIIGRQSDGRIFMGTPTVTTGKYEDATTGYVRVLFTRSDDLIGEPYQIDWDLRLGDWHPGRDGWVESVITAPSGKSWRGFRRRVSVSTPIPRERDRFGGSAPGPGGDPDLISALDQGGIFILSFEDHEGHRWGETRVDLPDAVERRLEDEDNLARFRATDPESIPMPQRRLDLDRRVVAPRTPRH